jgi:hypothetical protein
MVVPQNLPRPETLTTNLAIKPDTTDGYLTVGRQRRLQLPVPGAAVVLVPSSPAMSLPQPEGAEGG